jgi:CRP-like cAMP-binding protein
MPTLKQDPSSNTLLAALPRKDYSRLRQQLETVEMTFGQILHEPGAAVRTVYFPTGSLVSLLTVVEGHLALEVGMVGREGMVGVGVAAGISASPVRALVQGAGEALGMSAGDFRRELQLCAPLGQAVYRYTHALMAQITQTAACNRFHVVEARLARWLLMTRDRVRSPDFRLTHEFLGHMLGVRRVGVTEAASSLQRRNLIEYSRGSIRILNNLGLEKASCACYAVLRGGVSDVAAGGRA